MDGQEFGVGNWKTRDGTLAVVKNELDHGNYRQPLVGIVAGVHGCWNRDGSYLSPNNESGFDLVGAWEEPGIVDPVKTDVIAEPTPKVNPYEQPNLRDFYAMAAMEGMCCNGYMPATGAFAKEPSTGFLAKDYAEKAYELADAMLAARKADAHE